MKRHRFLLAAPLVLVLGAVLVVTLLGSGPPQGDRALTFTFDGDDAPTPFVPAVIRRRTITPEFDPPLELRFGRAILARGFIACDEGEAFVVNVTVTQGDATARGRTGGRCTGEVQEWRAWVYATDDARFSEGPAHACAVATTRREGVTDRFRWCADPLLVSST